VIVLDASAAIELLRGSPVGLELARRLCEPDTAVHAPHLLTVEVAQVLRRLAASGALSDERARQAIDDLAALDVARYEHEPFLDRMWSLRHNLTAYDAAYVALAEVLDAPLVTMDARLAEAPGHDAQIELLRG
jgi:predicted nucleic acid-binding protein